MERKADNVDAFISPSAFSAEKHKEFGFPRDLDVVPYFLPDPDSGAESQEDDPADAQPRPYFLFVGRLEKIKGLQDVFPHFGADALVSRAWKAFHQKKLHRKMAMRRKKS